MAEKEMQNRPRAMFDAMAHAIDGIDGWLYPEEAWELHEAARRAAGSVENPTIVEVGSWKGRSTVALASGLRAAGRGRVFAIDPHTGTDAHATYGEVDTFSEFMHNIDSRGLSTFVEPLRSTGHSIRSVFSDRSVHVLYMDGSHEYGDVLQDIEDWTSALADGAEVAFNDFSWRGVSRALRERVVRFGSPFRSPRLVRDTLYLEYQPNAPWTARDTIKVIEVRAITALRVTAFQSKRFLPGPLLRWARVKSEQLVNPLGSAAGRLASH